MFQNYIKQQRKEIAEQRSESSKKIMELELERIQRDLESNYYQKKAQIVLDGLKEELVKEEKILEDIKKKITLAERNHKVEIEEEKKDGLK